MKSIRWVFVGVCCFFSWQLLAFVDRGVYFSWVKKKIRRKTLAQFSNPYFEANKPTTGHYIRNLWNTSCAEWRQKINIDSLSIIAKLFHIVRTWPATATHATTIYYEMQIICASVHMKSAHTWSKMTRWRWQAPIIILSIRLFAK